MSEFVERVAWVLIDIGIDEPDATSIARRIIATMREPTEAMVNAAVRRNDDNDGKEADRENWQSMIDAALKDTSASK